MKKNYTPNLFKRAKSKVVFFSLSFLCSLFSPTAFSQQSYTFTPAGATGSLGPTQLQVSSAYLLTNLNGSVTIGTTPGVQTWTVPLTGNYRIEARGAQGVGPFGGHGAAIAGDFNLTAGTVIKILVGQSGILSSNTAANFQYGGGGGSFVTNLANVPYVVAGGGGGSWATSYTGLSDGTVTINGNPGITGTTMGAGGIGGGGGGSGNAGDGGGGFTGNGTGTSAGLAFLNGGTGGTTSFYGIGGFGGGAGTSSYNNTRCGGGGGYSGGGGVDGGANGNPQGGGGGSYNNGVNQVNITGFNIGDGKVIITALCNINLSSITANSPGSICSGSSATLTTNAISNYAWSTGGTLATAVVSPTVTTSYTLTATSPSNCTASAIITITVDVNTPTVNAVINTNPVCAGKSVILTATGATTYSWSNGAINGSPYVPLSTSAYTVVGANGCGSSAAIVNVTVIPLPNVTASVNTPTVCNGSTIILTGGGSVGGYTWTAGAPNNSAFVPPATNVYTVTGIAANGCTASAVAGVTVLVTPTITPVVTPTAICLGANAVLSAVGATGYTWTPGTNLFASTATVSPAAATTYTLVRTNGQCTSTTNITLGVNPLPLVNASATPSQICTGAAINLVVIGPITNTWAPGGFTQSNFNVYPNLSTSYTVTGSNGSCTAQAIVPIVVNPSPVISINSSTNTICQGSSATLTVSGTGPLTYTWSSGNNGVTEVVSSNSSTIISVSATNTLNCVSSLNQLILVNPLPDMSVVASPSFICAGDQAILSLTQATASTNNNVAYTWSAPGSGPNITVTPTLTTTYNVAGTNTLTGCQNSNTVTLAVYISTFSISSPTAICKGETATLTAAGQPTSYVWTVVSGNNTAPSVTVSPVINTTYSVTGTNGSCNTTSQVAVIVNPIPNVTALVAKGQICKFEISTITGSGANTYSWSTGASTPVLSFTLSVTTNYTLTGTDLNGCAKTVTVSQFVATCLGIEDTKGNANVGLNVYPNPNNGNFIITSDANITLTVINSLGQVISTMKLSEENKKEITVSTLPNGIYFITGEANGQKVTKKIVVER